MPCFHSIVWLLVRSGQPWRPRGASMCSGQPSMTALVHRYSTYYLRALKGPSCENENPWILFLAPTQKMHSFGLNFAGIFWQGREFFLLWPIYEIFRFSIGLINIFRNKLQISLTMFSEFFLLYKEYNEICCLLVAFAYSQNNLHFYNKKYLKLFLSSLRIGKKI